jgi:type I restriction enzyme S subunit
MNGDWASATVSQLVEQGVLFVEDGNHGENRPLAAEFVEDGTPFVRPDDLKDGRVDFEGCDRINNRALARVRKGKGKAGDILFTHRATVGRIARVGDNAPPFVANPGVTVWRSINPAVIDSVYLYFFMQTRAFMDQVWAEAGNTDTFPYISLTQQRRLRLWFPSILAQRAIASILGTLDDRIELNRRMSETLEAIARALFQSWFVDFDPVRAKIEGRNPGLRKPVADLFPARLLDSELGEIPAGWHVKPVGDLTEVVGGSTPKTERPDYWDGGTHHWVTPKDLSGLSLPVLLDTERKITNAGLAQISSGLLPIGTVLLSSRAPIGYLAIANVPVAVNQGFIAMKPRPGTSNLFLLRWAAAAHDEILSRANGSTFLEISKANFRPIRTVVPPGSVMDTFDRLSRPLYRKVVENERESRTLASVRDALLPKLICGELRVKDAEKFVATVSE